MQKFSLDKTYYFEKNLNCDHASVTDFIDIRKQVNNIVIRLIP